MLVIDYNSRVASELNGLPITSYHIDSTHPVYRPNMHSHQHLEIAHIISGKATIILDQNTVCAEKGDFIIVNPNVIHTYQPRRCAYDVLVFDVPKLILPFSFQCDAISAFNSNDYCIDSLQHPSESNLYNTLCRLFDLGHTITQKNLLTQVGLFYEFLNAVYEAGAYTITNTNVAKQDKYSTYIKPVLQMIEKKYMENITLTDMAHLVNASTSHFSLLFQKYMQETPKDYLNTFRINQACLLLTTTEFSITEIAYRCGFNDSAYFSRLFSKKKLMTPRQYRNMTTQ